MVAEVVAYVTSAEVEPVYSELAMRKYPWEAILPDIVAIRDVSVPPDVFLVSRQFERLTDEFEGLYNSINSFAVSPVAFASSISETTTCVAVAPLTVVIGNKRRKKDKQEIRVKNQGSDFLTTLFKS
jgi:hypothetical protein